MAFYRCCGNNKPKLVGSFTGNNTTTYDIASFTSNYKNLTVDNFLLDVTNMTAGGSVDGATYDHYSRATPVTKSYDAETGTLTLSGGIFSAGGRDYNYGDHSAYGIVYANVYLIK